MNVDVKLVRLRGLEIGGNKGLQVERLGFRSEDK